MRKLERKHMEVILAIDTEGSVHRAAAAMRTSQPAVSRVLREAEEALGFRIFTRTTRGCSLTEAGSSVLVHAQAALAAIGRIEAQEWHGPVKVRLGCIPRAVHTLLPRLLESRHGPALLTDQYRIQLVEESSNILVEQLMAGKLDFAIVRPAAGSVDIDSRLEAVTLYAERPVFIAAANNAAYSGGRIRAEQIAAAPMAGPSIGTPSRVLLDRYWQERGIPAPAYVIQAKTFESILSLVSQTQLVSILPQRIASHYARLGVVKVLDVRPQLPGSEVMLLCEEAVAGDERFRGFMGSVVAGARAAQRSR